MEILIMKKIVILALLSAIFFSLPSFSACKLEDIQTKGSCKAAIDTPPQTLQERLVPNNLNQIVNPNKDTFATPTKKEYPIPETVNMNPAKQPDPVERQYDANCQFGVCLPGETGVIRE